MATDFESLDPETRCFALVGQFLQAWSVMEESLHNAIGAALSIDAKKLQILCANMRFRDKINILRTLIDVAESFSSQQKTELLKELQKLADFSGFRNMIAHAPFHPDESKEGVEFLTVKAKGKFDLPNVVWSAERFQTEGETIDQYCSLLDKLKTQFEAKPLQYRDYAAALLPFVDDHTSWSIPMRRTMSPALLDALNPQAETFPVDAPLTPKADHQTPDKPRE